MVEPAKLKFGTKSPRVAYAVVGPATQVGWHSSTVTSVGMDR